MNCEVSGQSGGGPRLEQSQNGIEPGVVFSDTLRSSVGVCNMKYLLCW